MDVAPTIVQMLGYPKPDDMQGVGLLGLMLGKEKDLQLEAYSETYYPTQFGWSALHSLRLSNSKYIEAPRQELYDLQQDPHELKNTAGEKQALAKQLKIRLQDLKRSLSDLKPQDNSQSLIRRKELEKLAALGYIGGPTTGRSAMTDNSGAADPKDKIDIFYEVNRAGLEAESGKCTAAEPRLLGVIQREPGMVAAHFMLGRCYFIEQKFSSAQQSFQRLLKLDPQNTEAQFYSAACDFKLDRLAVAEKGFKRVLATNPKHTFAHKYLGFIYQAQGDTQASVQEFQKVLETAPDDVEAHGKLGFLLAGQSKFSEAIPHLRKVVESMPSEGSAHFNLGLAYLKNNQKDLAEKELLQACKLDPQLCAKR